MGMRFEAEPENMSDVIADAVRISKARVQRAQARVDEIHESHAGDDPATVLAALRADREVVETVSDDEQLQWFANEIAAGERPIVR